MVTSGCGLSNGVNSSQLKAFSHCLAFTRVQSSLYLGTVFFRPTFLAALTLNLLNGWLIAKAGNPLKSAARVQLCASISTRSATSGNSTGANIPAG